MTGKYNIRQSWEKCQVWDLDNGWQVDIQYSQIYGEHVTRLSKDGKHWHASDGYDNPYGQSSDPIIAKVFADHIALPEFAKPWIEVVHKLFRDNVCSAQVQPLIFSVWSELTKKKKVVI